MQLVSLRLQRANWGTHLAFNHAQYGLPVNDVSAPGFGSVNSTVNNARLVQFGLKLTF